ncbi:TetR/AcrR family transcriptional regulator [Amorphus orientalis]|uniref:AcrR family transcriptional regulator n=1 Tax=Amorphus orientalis TaxID=649198 RepID=A0AAE4ASI1_9HYPH|nr:TetR/AcrR family transcriptional regulator [Amorphus orientalis]MDQ0315060.1 AcrR family transcriptional regulator [Amorphus orientalis]
MNKAEQLPGRSKGQADAPKRKEILDGARQVFRAAGFDGASMDKIAQVAGVSKGTLYVYFHNKEELFLELVHVDRKEAAEQIFLREDDEIDVATMLQELGEKFLTMMIQPSHVALVRMVIGAAEKFPEAGQTFFEMGPCFGIDRLAAYLERQASRGRIVLNEDPKLAAAHFLNLCHGDVVKRLLFGYAEQPSRADVRATVDSAVRVFLKAYGA